VGRRKRDGNHSPKKKLIQDSEGDEENGYPVHDQNETKINNTKKPSDAHKNNLKEESLQVITENFMEKIPAAVNQNIQNAVKKFQHTKNKEYKKTQKQINELIGVLNKHQSATENTINREINELKVKIENIKEVVTHDMENLRKMYETEIQNIMEGHSSRLEQAEDRISKLEDREFQDGDYREEAESKLPKVNSWRDTGDTHGRKNHQEEAKL
jgi:hypothetical protein